MVDGPWHGAALAPAVALTPRVLLRAAGRLAGGVLILFAAGFAVFVAAVEHRPPAPPHADGIVVLTGGAERVETALRLLRAGAGDRLLVSGVARGAGLQDIGRRDFDPAPIASRVTLGHGATSTFGNAGETAAWVREMGIRSLIVVTAAYHMPRALLELRRAMPAVALYPLPVAPPALSTAGLARLLAIEYAKLIAAWCGVSHLTGRPGLPVGNFVSG